MYEAIHITDKAYAKDIHVMHADVCIHVAYMCGIRTVCSARMQWQSPMQAQALFLTAHFATNREMCMPYMRALYVSPNLHCKRSTLLVQRRAGEVQVLEEHPH